MHVRAEVKWTYLAIVTILDERTSRRVIILTRRRMLMAMKTIPDGRAGRKGLMSGIVASVAKGSERSGAKGVLKTGNGRV